MSPWVAAWFACHEHSDVDGAIWWSDQSQFENVIGGQWDNWRVPIRAEHLGVKAEAHVIESLGLNERAFETTAFDPHGPPWISKIHYRFPCSRMEAQQGFATACGRLRMTQNEAIDGLPDSESIGRGRILIAAGIKGQVLDFLRTMNVHARSLEYPGVDIVASRLSL